MCLSAHARDARRLAGLLSQQLPAISEAQSALLQHQQPLALQQSAWAPFGIGARSLRTSVVLFDAVDVKVPQMGESVSEGTIAAILKKPGADPGDWPSCRGALRGS